MKNICWAFRVLISILQMQANWYLCCKHIWEKPGRVAQSVTYLATDASLTADPGVASSIPTRSHTFVEIDHEIISTVILLPSAESFKKGYFSYKRKYGHEVLVNLLVQACPGKSVVRWTDRPAMTIAVDLGRKATKQTNIWEKKSSRVTGYLFKLFFFKFFSFFLSQLATRITTSIEQKRHFLL